jgi:hypothetical protein
LFVYNFIQQFKILLQKKNQNQIRSELFNLSQFQQQRGQLSGLSRASLLSHQYNSWQVPILFQNK